MKTLLAASLIAAAATAASGCAPLDMSVFVEEASSMDEKCSATGDTKLASGSLDLGPSAAVGALPRYIGLFRLRSDLEPTVIQSGDDVLAGNARNEFVATGIQISYQSTGGVNLPQATEPIYFVILPGTNTGTILFDMLSTQAAQAIAQAVPAGGADTLVATFRFEGNVRSSSNGLIPMHTPLVNFPIHVYHSNTVFPSCTAPAIPVLKGPCGNSQESYTIDCSQ